MTLSKPFFAALISWACVTPVATAAECSKPPLGTRELYLRGSMNAWSADEAWRLRWRCDRYELLAAPPQGEQSFKLADDDWSADADWGRPVGVQRGLPPRLALRGAAIEQRFDGGLKRFELHFDRQHPTPRLTMSDCASMPPLGDTQLYLRGTMNNWAALDDYAFRWHCDAYLLNVELTSRHDFKIGDAAWSKPSIVAANAQGEAALEAQGGQGNFTRAFSGAHTLSLRFDAQGRPRLEIGPKTFVDASQSVITDKVALAARFNSRDLKHKWPFGAQPRGSELGFRVAAPGARAVTLVVEQRRMSGNQEQLDYLPLARVAMRRDGDFFSASQRFAEAGVYGYWFELETPEGRYALQNNRDAVHWTREKGSMGVGVVEALPDNPKRVRRYRQTIHLENLRVPDWAADVVYYYIFPERFRNGDKGNDPRPGRARYQNHAVERHAQWIERPHRPGESGDAVYNNDFFGGDLAGIIDKLDEIKDLGANTIYMTPVFRAASNHKYDTADYKAIDPGFGHDADFRRLTQEAAKRGMRVIPDTSLNHVGSDSRYFDRFGNFAGPDGQSAGAFANGRPNPASPYFSWFLFDTTKKDPSEQYQGWVGVKDLPELNKDSPAWRDFAFRAPDSVTRHWLRAGASGWRMDVAPWVNDGFWREWSAAVKETRPDALTVAETWFDASKYFLGDMFDSTMNYIFRNAVLDFAAGGKAQGVMANLELTREAYPAAMLHANMNLLSSHDQARALHHFGIHGDPHTATGIDPEKLREAKQRLLLAVMFQVAFPGAPTVYYGDEVGVGGGDDPYNRATYPWADEGGQPDLELRAAFQRLLKARHAHPVLRRGRLTAPLRVSDDLIVFERVLGTERALVLLSNRRSAQTVNLPLQGSWKDLFDGSAVRLDAIELPALSGRILLLQP